MLITRRLEKNMLTIKQKIEHLRNLGFTCDMTEIEKFYSGKQFDKNDEGIKRLIEFSKDLWREYSMILKQLPVTTDEEERAKLAARKDEIISTAFPKHGMFANICDGFYCTVGAVDFDKDSISSINKNVKFGKYTLAELGNYALIGEDIKIGSTFGQNIQPNKKIILGDDTWLCASTVVGAGARISTGTVLALGAMVYPNQITEIHSLSVGAPAQTKLIINSNYVSKKDNSTYRSKDEIQFITAHIRLLGMDVDEAFISALNGEKYNCFSAMMAQITEFSHNLSYEFNNPLTSPKRKKEILDILFPIQGKNFVVGDGLFVDILGLAKVGENVRIGKDSFFAGNVTLGNNITAGDNLILAGIGHELHSAGRRLREFKGVIGEVCEIGKIYVADNVTIGNNVTLAPGCVVSTDLPNNCFVINNNKIIAKPEICDKGNFIL